MRSAIYIAAAFVTVAAVAIAAPHLLSSYDLRILNLGLINAIGVIGLCFAFGYAGLIHLGQAAFMGIGAYGAAVLAVRLGISPLLAIPVSVVVGTLAAVLIGLPLLRLRGHYLALGTTGLVVTVEIIFKNWTSVTGGYDGLSGIPPILLLGRNLSDDRSFIYTAACLLFLIVLFGIALRRSRFGRAMIIVRDDELSAAASGVNVFRAKVLAFALSGGCGALSGALFAHYSLYIAPNDFDLNRSLMVLAMLILGGEVSFIGAILGSILLTFAPEWLRFVGNAYIAVFSVFLIIILIFLPNGLLGGLPSVSSWMRRRAGAGATK